MSSDEGDWADSVCGGDVWHDGDFSGWSGDEQDLEDGGVTDVGEFSAEREDISWDSDVAVVDPTRVHNDPPANHLEAIRLRRSFLSQHRAEVNMAQQFVQVFGDRWPPLPSLAQKNQRLRHWARCNRAFLLNLAATIIFEPESTKRLSLEEAIARFQCAVSQYTPQYVLYELARIVKSKYVADCFDQGSLADFSPPADDPFDDDGKWALRHVARQFHAASPALYDEAQLVMQTGFGWFPVSEFRRRMLRKRGREEACHPSAEQTTTNFGNANAAQAGRSTGDPYLHGGRSP